MDLFVKPKVLGPGVRPGYVYVQWENKTVESHVRVPPGRSLKMPKPLLNGTTSRANGSTTTTTPSNSRLLNLPVELRTKIYGHLLVQKRAIRLEVRHVPRHIFRVGSSHKKNKGLTYNRRTKSWTRNPLRHTSILAVNKQTYREAEEVLYGMHVFSFERTTVLNDFLKTVGSRAQYLRHMRIEGLGYMSTNAKETFKLLTAAKGLRKLEFAHRLFCIKESCYRDKRSRITFEQVARDLGPLLVSLQESYKDRGLNGSVWDVIGLYGNSCYACKLQKKDPESGEDKEKNNQHLLGGLHDIISKRFKIAR